MQGTLQAPLRTNDADWLRSHEYPNTRLEHGSAKLRDARTGAPRPALLVNGDLHNIGDLALAAQNIFTCTHEGRASKVRTWGPVPDGVEDQLAQWGAQSLNGKRLMRYLRCARASDIIIGGGELVRANNSVWSLLALLAGVMAARNGGGDVCVRGLGASRVCGARAVLWRAILRRASHIAVRDQRSADALTELRADLHPVIAADMAFWGSRLPALADGLPSTYQDAVVIAPCVDPSEQRVLDPAKIAAIVAAARARWPRSPVVMACHDWRPAMDPDAILALTSQGGFRTAIFTSGGDLARMQAFYREAKVVLTNRLHAGIFALRHARPVIVLDDGNPKLALLRQEFGCASLSANVGASLEAACIESALDQADSSDRHVIAAQCQGLAERTRRNLEVHRTAIFNVKYSPNLGDGIIAECLEGELTRASAGIAPLSIDLAGRTQYSKRNGRLRAPLLSGLERLPGPVRRRLVPLVLAPLVRWRFASRWRSTLRRCNSVVIGGGALFADADQNFPIKISQALDLAWKQSLPVAVASVGVSTQWSAQGRRRLAKRLLRNGLISATVRDSNSSAAWCAVLGTLGVKPATLAPDPGLLSERQFGQSPLAPDERKRVALCATAPLALRLHHENSHTDQALEAWMRTLALQLVSRGCQVTMFTNGSPEDQAFMAMLQARLADATDVQFADPFANPGELARFVSGQDCILAHRLHACIIAYSYRIPSVGFAWDRKLHSFFEQTQRSRFVIDPRESSPMAAADLTLGALSQPIDETVHSRLVTQTTEAIHALAGQLAVAGAQP